MKTTLNKYLFVLLLCSAKTSAIDNPVIFDLIDDEEIKAVQLPSVYMGGTRTNPYFLVFEDDYEELSEEGKKTLHEYYAPTKIHIKRRAWSFF